MSDFIQVSTTVASEPQARAIAKALVEQRLAACVQVSGPIESVYRWQGQLEQSSEWLCTVKTRSTLFKQVEAAIRLEHNYDCPEIIAVPITTGSADYLAWLEAELLKS